MIRVAVVDDEPLARAGLRVILDSAEDLTVVADCPGVNAVETVRRRSVDVLLLDIRMPVVDGPAVLREVVRLPNPPAVAMLTTFDSGDHVDQALRQGAAGYLLKNTAPEQLIHAVRVLAAGGRLLAPEAAGRVIDGYLASGRDAEAERRVRVLSERERQVLALVGAGLSNRAIAGRLHLAHSTVKDHVSSLLAKLGGLNRVQAAVVADRADLAGSPRDEW
ncbi:response regulator transcription factor [Streptomyces sp. NPDC052012]|uniref:response regulator transcription factor n=1 Tax=Streptomyces sp. NPDC052012 TaxID=3155051 RepID=UPI00344DC44F